jgi:hypothetical protein
MRTKALLSLAALAVGATAAVAQSNVYSINVVGYYNVVVPANTPLIVANQLNTTNNTLPGVIPVTVAGAQFQKFNGGFSAFTFDDADNAWTPDASGVTLAPGEGGFFRSPSATTVTFVGEVPQGSLSNPLPQGFSIKGSQVPQAGTVSTLGYTPAEGDIFYKWNPATKQYTSHIFDPFFGGWEPSEPSLAVGEAVFLFKPAAGTWNRTFTVNN